MFERAKETIDADTDKMIDGIAFHWYTGDHFDAVSITRDAFPGKELIFSEGCVEYSRFDASQLKNAQMYAHDMIGNLNAGMTGFLDWNILLDVKGGPNHVGNNCDAPVMSVDGEDNFVQNLSFYYIGHFSRYIEKGAKRIACTKYTDKLEITGFKNPDGSIVCIILNRTTEDIPVTLRLDGKAVDIMIPQGTISTGIIQ
jgi:glucosylceramidase